MSLLRPVIATSQFTALTLRKWHGKLKTRREWGKSRIEYGEWLASRDSLNESMYPELSRSIALMRRRPLISVVMPVYNSVPSFLDSAIRSVRNQIYPYWELCIADDASTDPRVAEILRGHMAEDKRIKVAFRPENGHISEASNSALELVSGEYIALLDHDDMVSPDALYRAAVEIVEHPDAMLIYSDEDKLDTEGKRCDPHFKSDWNLDLFLACNMINHLGVYRTSVIREIGGFRKGFEGAQDYDLGLRFIEKVRPEQIRHIPRILYHWRMHENSVSLVPESKPYSEPASRRAIGEYFQRQGIEAEATATNCGIRVKYAPPSPPPPVTLIVTGSNPVFLYNCIHSLLEKTDYPDYEVLVAGQVPPRSLAECFGNPRSGRQVRILDSHLPGNPGIRGASVVSNKPALLNLAVADARGSVVGLIDSRLEVMGGNWLDEMVGHACRRNVGAVGARLFYTGNKIYHGGIILGMRGQIAGFSHKGKRSVGYAGRAALTQCFSAVSGECMVVRKELYQRMAGYNESLPALADIDFCLRLRSAGYRNIWTPYAELRFLGIGRKAPGESEVSYMKNAWGSLISSDPAYNPNLTLDREDFSLARNPRAGGISG